MSLFVTQQPLGNKLFLCRYQPKIELIENVDFNHFVRIGELPKNVQRSCICVLGKCACCHLRIHKDWTFELPEVTLSVPNLYISLFLQNKDCSA